MRDFTLQIYELLLTTLKGEGYRFLTFEEYCNGGDLPNKFVILRHDVDKLPENSQRVAEIEHDLSIKSSFYFRIVNKNNQNNTVRNIVKWGHEVGYHYEDVALCRGNMEASVESFMSNLQYFREFYPVRTICMHGSPTSRFDNREMWGNADYHAFGIVGEPYFDIDYEKVFYLTDTGRCWDGDRYSIRDKVVQQSRWKAERLTFHSTFDIIRAAKENRLPLQIMITTHPQRWTDSMFAWWWELLLQSAKNVVKRMLIKF